MTAVLALAACGAKLTAETRYVGDVTPQGACGDKSHGTLTTQGGKFAFTPNDGVLLLRGGVAADGTAVGELATQGADRKAFVMALNAKVSDEHVDGTYITPRCTFTVTLQRAS